VFGAGWFATSRIKIDLTAVMIIPFFARPRPLQA